MLLRAIVLIFMLTLAQVAAQVDIPLAHQYARDDDVRSLATLSVKEGKEVLTSKDSNGWEPIHEAAKVGSYNCVRLLSGVGADPNVRTQDGKDLTPLDLARANGHDDVAALLVEVGATDSGTVEKGSGTDEKDSGTDEL